ncbi:PAS domain-containing protein [Marinibaculum pumilum]|uniref:PAS domain-containing protein n=1 Tax=Marinibaculum pumilum TaxID=1766165 RepID=A0ABV7L820_9PROT
MLPNGLDAVCADRPLLLAFLEAIDGALDPVTGLPVRPRIDIVRLGRKGVLPNIWMIERGADGQFRYRLAGEEVVRNFGGSPRGKTLDEAVGPGAAARYGPTYETVLADRVIVFHRGAVRRGGRRFYDGFRLFVPVVEACGGDAPWLVLCCFDRDDVEPQALLETGLSYDSDVVRSFPLRPPGGGEARTA